MSRTLLLKGTLFAISMFFLAATINLGNIEWTLFMDIDFSQLSQEEITIFQYSFFAMFTVSFLSAMVIE